MVGKLISCSLDDLQPIISQTQPVGSFVTLYPRSLIVADVIAKLGVLELLFTDFLLLLTFCF
jgi:hypothetical protein